VFDKSESVQRLSFLHNKKLLITLILLLTVVLVDGIFFPPVAAADVADNNEPFTFPGNMGITGLMEIPTARVIRNEGGRVGASYIRPYWYYYGTLTPLPGLEINARITKLEGYPALLSGYGDYKDKAVDIKYQILSENKYLPALALGLMDIHGTRLFGSQYITASKQIYPFDFTIGFADGYLGDKSLSSFENTNFDIFKNPGRWLSEGHFFYGIQFVPSDNFALMLEYCPIEYDKQKWHNARDYFINNPTKSKFNIGMRWKPFSWSTLDISWQRGNQIGIGFSCNFNISNPYIPIYEHPYREAAERTSSLFEERLVYALEAYGFRNIGVCQQGTEFWVDVENEAYFFTPKALKTIVTFISDKLPPDVEQVHIVLKQNGIPLVHLKTTKNSFDYFNKGALSIQRFLHIAEISTENTPIPDREKHYPRRIDSGIKPIARFFLNDPSGFFKYRLGVEATSKVNLWKGASIAAGISFLPINTVSTSNIALPQAIRSDIPLYIQETLLLERLLFDQILKGEQQIHLRGTIGILDLQYAGVDAEVAMPLLAGRFMLGMSGSLVQKREAGAPLSLQQNNYNDFYNTAFFNTRLNIPEQEIAIDLKMGRFLAGDKGARITVSKFYNGLTLYAWYGITDTSVFNDGINNGYRDKGIGVSIPLRFFKGADSRTSYYFSISPWTRDVAQDIEHYNPLFDYIGRNVGIYIDKDIKSL